MIYALSEGGFSVVLDHTPEEFKAAVPIAHFATFFIKH
jgi:hypothetical protein